VQITKAVDRLNQHLPLTSRQRSLDPRLARLHRDILSEFARTGRPPRVDPTDARELAASDLVVLGADAVVVGAYPFSVAPTKHLVELPTTHTYAMCSLDALAIAPVFWTRTTIRSSCALKETSIQIEQDGDRLLSADPGSALVGIRWQDPTGHAATSMCRDMVFLAGTEEAEAWRGPDRSSAGVFTIDDAIEFAVGFFAPLLGDV